MDHDHRPKLSDLFQTRRQFLNRFGTGMGALSLATMLPEGIFSSTAAAANTFSPMAPKNPPLPAKAKRVIHIFAQGAPSQVDTWDPKPELTKFDTKSLPGKDGIAFGSPFKFKKSGKSGIEVSEVFPHLGEHVDEMAIIRSMHTDIPAHDFGTLMMNTGSGRMVKPSVGAWVTYGLGSLNQNLPGFIALSPGSPISGSQNWRSAFLPGAFQGTYINTRNTSIEKLIENIKNHYASHEEQREQLDLLGKLNDKHSRALQKDAELEARIQSFELAYQMQTEATDAFDVSREPEHIRAMYGADTEQGRQMLIARRLVEKGVRFVQVWHSGWDHHQNLETALRNKAKECDKAIAGLLTDLKQRGMLEDTLVVWGGEFGRTPTRQLPTAGNKFEVPGRNHNNKAYSMWMAGGGVKGGTIHGASDEFGGTAVEDKVHVHDLHATILALLGFDHEKLTYRYNGRDFRLTDVYGNVVKSVIA
jgi:hypothetical protein